MSKLSFAGHAAGRSLRATGWFLLSLLGLLGPGIAAAQTADLQVSEYSWTPEPVANGAIAVFTVRVTNNGPASANNATVTVGVAPNFQVSNTPGVDFPAFCSLSGAVGSQSLTCNIAPFGGGDDITFTYNAVAIVVGTSTATASIAPPAGVTDNNSGNNTIPPINPTVRQGVDLRVTKTPNKVNYVGGETVTYTIQASNAGPNLSAAVRMTDTLPPTTDLDTVSASGTNWSCAPSGVTYVCNYTGVALSGNYPPITLTGRVAKNIAGTITNVAAMSSTNALILENTPSNDGSGNVVVNVAPGADLAAFKSMPSPVVGGSNFNLTLRINNNGPFPVTGATIADTLDAGFVIGTLPLGCANVAQTITCTGGVIGSGASQTFTIPLTAPSTPTSGTNSATVAPPGGITDPIAGNNSTSVGYSVVAPFADLSVSKSKGPNPVQSGSPITSTLIITNNGVSTLSYTPALPVIFTDQIGANERITAVSVGWTCVGLPVTGPATVTCRTTGTGTVNSGSTLTVSLTADPVGLPAVAPFPNVANTACVGGTAGSLATPIDNNAANDCASAGAIATTRVADLRIAKESSLAVGGAWLETVTVGSGVSSWFYRLTVDNQGTDTAPTVNVNDTLPNYLNNAGFTTNIIVRPESTLGAGGSCSVSAATVSCSLTDIAGSGADVRTIILEIQRPVESGSSTNTASVSSPDAVDTNGTNNSDTASVTVNPIADVEVTSKVVSPDPAVVGQNTTYIISYRNRGPNPASGVQITDTVDPTRFAIVGTPTTTAPGGNCTVNSGTGAVTCTLPSALARGDNYQASIQVRPLFPFGGATAGFPISHTNTATIATTTVESNAGNNSGAVTHNVNQPALDIRVTKVEPAAGDPLIFGSNIVYLITLRNNGPSRATDVRMIDTPTGPAGYTMSPSTAVVEVAGTNAPARAPVCFLNDPAANQIRCIADNNLPDNYLDAGEQIQYRVTFTSAGADPAGPLTYNDDAVSSSAETRINPAYDTDTLNNSEGESTTVVPRTDLEVLSKSTVTASPVNVNQPVTFQIVFRNNGPSPTDRIRLVETLPPGFTRTATAVSTSVAGAASVTTVNCGTGNAFNCDFIGSFPVGAGNTVTLTLEARANYAYAGALGAAVTNNVSIEPGRDLSNNPVSGDSISTNNTGSSTVSVQAASLAGNVYSDNDRGNDLDAGEGLAGVQITLSGTDIYGNTFSNITTTTAGNGSYSFGVLPPGTYALVETHPTTTHADSTEFAGSLGAGATGANTAIAASVCPPTGNCGSAAAQNTISGISLTAGTNATNYNFQEVQLAAVSGFVFRDANNDGQRGGGETGINGSVSPVQIRLTGTDYAGNAINVLQSTNNSGAYSFAGLTPSDSTGYTLTEVNEPSGYVDGRDQNGAGAGNVIANSAGRAVGETIAIGTLNPGVTLTERNFGELLAVTIAGTVYVDSSGDAIRQGGETATITGATITLTGTNDLGQAINCSTVTGGTGGYLFPLSGNPDPLCNSLRPGSYAVALTPPGGLTVTGGYSGNLGGSGQPANTALPAATNINSITLASGAVGTDYNFGVQGQGLTGSVYVDTDNDGVRDAGERGIPGVSITLSGNSAGGVNVCTLIAPSPCTAITDSSGNYQFLNLPASDATGYTLTEQSQASPPLTQYSDGIDTVGTVGGVASGTAANDQLSGIVMSAGSLGLGYNFGERPAGLSGGVYLDANNNGIREAGELPIAGVIITLSGTTSTGLNVCTVLPTCTFVTDALGNYSIPELPAGTYTLTQTQPVNYADGIDTAGTIAGSTVGSAGGAGTSVISNIVMPAGGGGIQYIFGELPAGLAGRVCVDINNNGCEASEPPLAGVTITLTGTSIGGLVINSIAITATDGTYSFANLPTPNGAGYSLTETQPSGYGSSVTNTTIGTSGGSVANNGISGIPLPAGTAATGYNFGELQADVSLTKSVTPTRLNIGQSVTFTIRVTNAGPTATTGVLVRDQLPAGYSFTSAVAPSGTSYDSSTGLWTIGNLANAQSQTLSIAAVTLGGGPYLNTAEVTASGVPDPDSTPANNLAAEDDQAAATVIALAVVTGHVYEDRNGNQLQDPGEPSLGNLPVVVTDSTGVAQTINTDANGDYRADVAPGTVSLNPQEPAGYRLTTANDPQSVNVPASATPTPSPPVGYQALGGVTGSVWFDAGSTTRQRDGNDTGLSGWIVELVDPTLPPGSAPVRSTLTDANGDYAFTQVVAGTYLIQFRDPATQVAYGTPVNGNNNKPQSGSRPAPLNPRGQLEVTIVAAQTLPQQSLPVDPSGVVYDAVTRQPVAGAVVTFRPVGVCAGYNAATMLVNAGVGGYTLGAGQSVSMTTGANGFYQFLLGTNAPASCNFELAITPPAAYRAPSTLIPASPTLALPPGLGNALIQPQATAPTITQSTTYHLQLVVGSATQGVIHNHIPLDPAVPAVLSIEKLVDRRDAEIGDSVRYTLRVRNVQGGILPGLFIDDRLPLGFRYIPGTARRQLGSAVVVAQPDPVGGVGPRLTFAYPQAFAPGQQLTITYRVRLGVGADQGDGVNRARARSGAVQSNEARAKVGVRGGVFTAEACVVGKIYVDCNENQIQDPEEVGVPGVRLYFEDGTYLISDSEGKYSYCGLKPVTHVLKVDSTTLPRNSWLGTTGSRNAGDPDSLFVDLKAGELHRADFRIASCTTDVVNQVFGRRTLGEVRAPDVEKGPKDKPAVTLDPEKETRCELPRHVSDEAYQQSPGDCKPEARR